MPFLTDPSAHGTAIRSSKPCAQSALPPGLWPLFQRGRVLKAAAARGEGIDPHAVDCALALEGRVLFPGHYVCTNEER